MSTQGNWSGDYQGEWFGSSGGPGPDYKIAELIVTGTGTAEMLAEVLNPQPPEPPSGGGGGSGASGGHIGAAERLKKRKEFDDFLTRVTAKPLLTETEKEEICEEVRPEVITSPIEEDDEEIAAIMLLLL